MKKLLFIVLLFPIFSPAQQKSRMKNYHDYLFDNGKSFFLFYGGLHYIYTVSGKMCNSGHGLEFNGGINVARFFTKKVHIGIFGAYKPRELLWSGSFRYTFSNSLSDNASYSSLNHSDSLMASYFVYETKVKNAIGGVGYYTYGISFSLPFDYFPLIKIYKSFQSELIDSSWGPNGSPSGTKDEDWIYLNYHVVGIEATVLPPGRISDNHYPPILDFFFEQDDLTNAKINNVKLSSFENPTFFNQYKKVIRFGIKIGIEGW